jgi:hypothetical protein
LEALLTRLEKLSVAVRELFDRNMVYVWLKRKDLMEVDENY